MARMMAKAKTSRLNRAATSAPCDASAYCRDLDNWSRSWMGLERDLPPGEALVVCFRPFIEHLASSSLSPKTIRRHVDNLWLLDGEIIRDLHCDPSLRKVAIEGFSATRSTRTVARSFTTARRRSNAPSMPPAANSTASSLNPSAEPASYPQIPRMRFPFRVRIPKV
jgi:hypothetical protein